MIHVLQPCRATICYAVGFPIDRELSDRKIMKSASIALFNGPSIAVVCEYIKERTGEIEYKVLRLNAA